MLDFFHIPSANGSTDIQIFNRPSTVQGTQWTTWSKPRGKTMLSIFCVGGGSGGGGGFSAAAAAARGGGGGGGSGAISRVIVPLILLPDTLYIQVGDGGAGGAAGAAGSAGLISMVTVYPDPGAANTIALSGANTPGAGGGGTGAAVGAAGTAGTIAAITAMPLAGMGIFAFIAGNLGIAGGAVAGGSPTAQTIPTSSILTMGGCGGAGTTSADFAGGLINAISNSLISEARPQGAPAGSNNGSGGYLLQKPFFSFSGLGGSSSNAGVGGNGGNGGPGSGGGGGGGGTTGGRGGDGGDGLVIMTAW